MGKFSLLTAIAATLVIGGAAVAKEKTEEAPKGKKICKVVRETTSRIPKKICRTQAEIGLTSAQDDLDDAVSKLRAVGRVD